MRGVNLEVFDFDYDLTWMAFFLRADERIYGRYGGRTPDSATAYLTLEGLRHALTQALAAHQKNAAKQRVEQRPPRTPDQYAAAKQLTAKACIHCHHVYDFQREDLQAKGTWRLDYVWVYPPPENVGWTLDANQGNRIQHVVPQSSAERSGMRAGDVLRHVNGQAVASLADVQYALHGAPLEGQLAVSWRRGEQILNGKLELTKGWRKTDVSWRWSLRGLKPASGVHGYDLTPVEKKALGLDVKQLAFRQGAFVTPSARHAGVLQNDIIIGVDGKKLEMTARQFDAYVRLSYRAGDQVVLNISRNGKRLDLTMKLSE